MSVLIKDMEKPKSCYAVIDGESEYCPFVNTDDDCVILLKKGICEGTWEEQYSKCPLIEEPERKTGKWIDETFKPWGLVYHPYKCDQCGEHSEADSNFCPNCGADMRGEEDATSICKCPCEYREPCDYCHYDAYRGHGCPAEEGLKDE